MDHSETEAAMEMYEPMQTADISKAWLAAFSEIEGATKNSDNFHFKSKFADLPAVIAAIKPHLLNHGLSFIQRSIPDDKGIRLQTLLLHESGAQMDMGTMFFPAAKDNDPQKFGSASTYCRRYALITAFGLPVFDDDGNSANSSGSGNNGADKWADTLSALRNAAMQGTDALRGEFLKHNKKPGFTRFFAGVQESLVSAAKSADDQ